MRGPLFTTLLCLAAFGCARIYRPVELAAMPPLARGGRLAASAVVQSWGDNSRYEARALEANLRLLVLTLDNDTNEEIQILGLELPPEVSAPSAEEALRSVQQQPLLYLLYPLVPGLMAPGSSNRGSFGPSDRAVFTFLAAVGLAIGVPNALVAHHSNRRLGAFLQEQAWRPGPLRPGEVRRGLLFLRNRDPYAPVTVQVITHTAAGERRLPLLCPGLRPSTP
jgi:hypothetical protein